MLVPLYVKSVSKIILLIFSIIKGTIAQLLLFYLHKFLHKE